MSRAYSARRDFWISVGCSLLFHAVILCFFLGWTKAAESPPTPVDVEWAWVAPNDETTKPLRKESMAGVSSSRIGEVSTDISDKFVPAAPLSLATAPAQTPADLGGGAATHRGRPDSGDKMESRPLVPNAKGSSPARGQEGSGDVSAPPDSPGFSGEGGSTGYALTPPRLKERPPSQWPPKLSSTGPLQVLLLVEVMADGRVGKIGVSRSSGLKAMDDAARENVARWRFEPAWQPQGNKPVRVLTSIWIRYTGEGG